MKRALLILALMFVAWLNISAQSMKMTASFRDGSTTEVEISMSNDISLTAAYRYAVSEDAMYLVISQGFCQFDEDLNLSETTTDENAKILFKEPVTKIEELRFETSSGVKQISDVVGVIIIYKDNTLQLSNVKTGMSIQVYDLSGTMEDKVETDGDVTVDFSSLDKGVHLLVIWDRSNRNVYSSKIVVK